nr:ribonuclease domain-containing protein [Pseudoxanthomonas dokdonensis]
MILLLLIVVGAGYWYQQRAGWAGDESPAVVADAATPAAARVEDGRVVAPLALPDVSQTSPEAASLPAFLPAEARQTLQLIARGGPFPHRQDGSVFANREARLPARPRGYYHEYTVDTPGLDHRGTRRIVTGGQPPEVYYYTDDHYESFRSFQPTGTRP